jgi:hypothetical protein
MLPYAGHSPLVSPIPRLVDGHDAKSRIDQQRHQEAKLRAEIRHRGVATINGPAPESS